MLANFFNKSKPFVSLTVVLLYLILYLIFVFSETVAFDLLTIPFFLVLFGLVNFIVAKNELTLGNSYAFLFFVLLIGLFYQVNYINETFYVNFLLLVYLRRVYSLQSPKRTLQKLFDSGFWLGITCLLEPLVIIFFVILYMAILLHRQINIRTLLTPILGFIPPVFLYFTYCFWFDALEDFYALFNGVINYNFNLYMQQQYAPALLITGIFVGLSVFLKSPKVFAVKDTFRSSWLLVILNLILSIVLTVLVKDKSGSAFLYLLFPVSVILANGLELFQKKKIADVVICLFIIAVIITNVL